MNCACAYPHPWVDRSVMGSGRVRCRNCGHDLAPESWVIKLHDLPPNVAGLTADDPYAPTLPRTRFTDEGVD